MNTTVSLLRAAALAWLALAVWPAAGCSTDGDDAAPDAGGDAGDGGDSDADSDADGPLTVEVPADAYWVNTGVYARAGDEIAITASGEWTMWEGTWEPHGPGGMGMEYQGCELGALGAMVGLHWNDMEQPICVQEELTFAAPRDGILYLAALDGGREDNAGAVIAVIETAADRTPTVPLADVETFDYAAVDAEMLELAGAHIILTLSTDYVAAAPEDAAAALAEFDAWYEIHTELASAVPYGGQPVRYYPDPDILDIGAWGLSGNPIRVMQEEGFLDVHDIDFGVWGYVHELGHDFSFVNGGGYMVGGGPVEAWCNVWTTYAHDVQGRADADRWQQQCADADLDGYLASGDYTELKNDPWIPLCLLMELQQEHGWELYEDFFALIFGLPASELVDASASDAERWGWVRDRLNEVSGADVTAKLLEYHIPLPG